MLRRWRKNISKQCKQLNCWFRVETPIHRWKSINRCHERSTYNLRDISCQQENRTLSESMCIMKEKRIICDEALHDVSCRQLLSGATLMVSKTDMRICRCKESLAINNCFYFLSSPHNSKIFLDEHWSDSLLCDIF